MVAANQRHSWLLVILGIAFLALLVFWWLNQGYGKVSPRAYEYSKALYGACLKRSSEHLKRVEEQLDRDDQSELTTTERRWIEQLILLARDGHWDSAAQEAKQIMTEQVDYGN